MKTDHLEDKEGNNGHEQGGNKNARVRALRVILFLLWLVWLGVESSLIVTLVDCESDIRHSVLLEDRFRSIDQLIEKTSSTDEVNSIEIDDCHDTSSQYGDPDVHRVNSKNVSNGLSQILRSTGDSSNRSLQLGGSIVSLVVVPNSDGRWKKVTRNVGESLTAADLERVVSCEPLLLSRNLLGSHSDSSLLCTRARSLSLSILGVDKGWALVLVRILGYHVEGPVDSSVALSRNIRQRNLELSSLNRVRRSPLVRPLSGS